MEALRYVLGCGLARAAFSLKLPAFPVVPALGKEAVMALVGGLLLAQPWVLEQGVLWYYSPSVAFEEGEDGCSNW